MCLGLLFPGQGSQHLGMGRELAREFPVVATTFEEADDVLEIDLRRIAWEGPDEELVETRNAQPAILAHSVAVYRLVRERFPAVKAAAGHSLGEFSAHVAADTLGYADALRAVRRRGELMFEAGERRRGTMAAILGLDDEEVDRVCRKVPEEEGVCVPANYNSAGQVVISGDVAAVERAMAFAREAGAKRVIQLNVSGAFHSPLMEPAREGLKRELATVEFRDSEVPVISNVTAREAGGPESARDLLVEQLTSPVRWRASIGRMVEAGIHTFLELGPGSVLCDLNRRNARDQACVSISGPDDLEEREQLEAGESA